MSWGIESWGRRGGRPQNRIELIGDIPHVGGVLPGEQIDALAVEELHGKSAIVVWMEVGDLFDGPLLPDGRGEGQFDEDEAIGLNGEDFFAAESAEECKR
jgi:hypothetical protein